MRAGLQRKLSTEELIVLNCGVRKDSRESLDCKETKPVNPKGNQTRIFIGRTDTETKVLILWTPYGKNSLIRKDPDVGKY